MDRQDILILQELQRASSRSIAELAQQAAVSPSACHRRIKALKAAGWVSGYGARLDPQKRRLKLQAFVEITLTSQSREAMDRFEWLLPVSMRYWNAT